MSDGLRELVREFTEAQFSGFERTITSTSVTDAFIRSQIAADEWYGGKNEIERAAIYGGVIAIVRPVLARRVPEIPDHSQLRFDLPEEARLQDWYSVRGEGTDNYRYRERSDLQRGEVVQIAKRFNTASVHLARHSDAIVAWFNREKPDELIDESEVRPDDD